MDLKFIGQDKNMQNFFVLYRLEKEKARSKKRVFCGIFALKIKNFVQNYLTFDFLDYL